MRTSLHGSFLPAYVVNKSSLSSGDHVDTPLEESCQLPSAAASNAQTGITGPALPADDSAKSRLSDEFLLVYFKMSP